MKVLGLLLAGLLASSAAVTDHQRVSARFIEGIVAGAIEDLSNNIRERGLDPLLISHSIDKRPPVTELFVLKAEIEELLVVGMSKIVLDRMTYSILFSTLTFEVSLPGIFISIASSSVDIKMLGNKFDGSISGSVNIIDTRISGRARIRLGIGGATITALTLDHSIRDIESDLVIFVLGEDMSCKGNNFVGITIPYLLKKNRRDINQLLEYYAMKMINENL
ncbi:unnamed protein product [Chilo suppressalis]|uniref:Lipid-binding serum glycoprotein N-terminal domain-containing protein n=1 Tax=Chilo suppressalis TaxID=168631 RepID=A0ABN8BBI0_CHISP|nr:unnamed protein product [Chilo suppressalis]